MSKSKPVSDTFNAYYEWLGIPPKHQPPDHYRLLGIERFEADPVVIEHAADQRLAFLRTKQTGKRGKAADQLLNEISRAKATLINANTKTKYDQALQNTLLKTAESTSSQGPHRSSSAPAARTADRSRGRGRNEVRNSRGPSSAASLLRFGLIAVVAMIAMAYGFQRWQHATEHQRTQQRKIAQVEETQTATTATTATNVNRATEEADRQAKEKIELQAKEEKERKAKVEAERKAKQVEERKAKEEAQLKAEQEAERKAKEEAERKAAENFLKQQKEAEQKQETLRWLKTHFSETKSGFWQPKMNEQWVSQLKEAKKTGSAISKDRKKFPKMMETIKLTNGAAIQAAAKFKRHVGQPPLNNAVAGQWWQVRGNLLRNWVAKNVTLNKQGTAFWTIAERFIDNLDTLEQEHAECVAGFNALKQLYKDPQMNRIKKISPEIRFAALKEKGKTNDLKSLQGIIDHAQPMKQDLITLNEYVQNQFQQAMQEVNAQQKVNRRK